MKRFSLQLLALAALFVTPSCATDHLLEWAADRPSAYDKPDQRRSIYLRAGGTFLALPVTVVWDVVTFPFQIGFGVHPYGEEASPGVFEQEGGRR